MFFLLPLQTLFLAAFVILVYGFSLLLYRLLFSPLAKIPGPKLAAATKWYEIYHDVFTGPNFPWKVDELHIKYGSIVRVGPKHVHIDDPEYASMHFTPGSAKRNKHDVHQHALGMPDSFIATADHDLHKIRRSAFTAMFSKRKIAQYEPEIQRIIDRLCFRLEEFNLSKRVLDLRLLFTCLAMDVVTECALARCKNLLMTEDLAPRWFSFFTMWMSNYHVFKHFPIIWNIVRSFPERFLGWVSPDMGMILDFQNDIKDQIRHIINHPDYKPGQHQTIFHEVLHSDLQPEEKQANRLWQEGQSIIGAGTETVSNALNLIMYHVLANPAIHSRLKDELRTIMPNGKAPWQQLETLPYLTAVIQEGLRMSYGISTPVSRVAPNEDIVYKGYIIPKGTAVSMSIMTLNNRADIFSDPYNFLPERWLERKGKTMEIYSFSKGPRGCLGMNLAYAELYLTLANVLHKFKLELYDTTREDVDALYDGYVPLPKHDSKGVRVLVY